MSPLYLLMYGARALGRRVADRVSTLTHAPALKRCGKGSIIARGVYIRDPRNVALGKRCFLQKGVTIAGELRDSRCELGNNVQINSRVNLDSSGGLIIGDNTLISSDSIVYTHDHGYDPRSVPEAIAKVIGRDVWIGTRAIILPSCRVIGDRAIVAAGAVVARDVPPAAIMAGCPARQVGTVAPETDARAQAVGTAV